MTGKEEFTLKDIWQTIWHWKWFILAVTIIITVFVGFKTAHQTKYYEATATLKVGKIAGVNLQKPQDLVDFCLGQEFQNKLSIEYADLLKNQQLQEFNVSTNESDKVYFKISTTSEQLTNNLLNYTLKTINLAHEQIFAQTKSSLKKMDLKEKQKIMAQMSSYNYETVLLKKTTARVGNNQVAKKTAIAFLVSFFLAIFLVFIVEFIKQDFKKEN